jgi:hypothetical protein
VPGRGAEHGRKPVLEREVTTLDQPVGVQQHEVTRAQPYRSGLVIVAGRSQQDAGRAVQRPGRPVPDQHRRGMARLGPAERPRAGVEVTCQHRGRDLGAAGVHQHVQPSHQQARRGAGPRQPGHRAVEPQHVTDGGRPVPGHVPHRDQHQTGRRHRGVVPVASGVTGRYAGRRDTGTGLGRGPGRGHRNGHRGGRRAVADGHAKARHGGDGPRRRQKQVLQRRGGANGCGHKGTGAAARMTAPREVASLVQDADRAGRIRDAIDTGR